jgi:copper/silver efflux system protein
MLERIIRASVANRGLVALLAVFLVAGGIWAVRTTPVDAIPDLSDVQVIVQTDWAEQAPQIVEDQVTYPLTTTLLAVPGATTVRGISTFGVSYVYVLFEEGTDPYWARSRVLEQLSQLGDRLPSGVIPRLGPDATGVGWVFQYTLESDRHDLAELRSIQDFFVRYQLQGVPGVAEVATVGGFVRQYQVDVDPDRLRAHGLSLARVTAAIREANADMGARVVEQAGREYMVRGLGYLESVSEIEEVVLASRNGTPIRVADVARVQLGPDLRRGVADKNGEGDVVTGIVIMRYGADALAVIDGVKARIADLQAGLPEGVHILPAYDRSELIREAQGNLTRTLVQVLLVTALLASLFLLHLRSALVVMVTLPVAVLFSFLVMRVVGVQSNLMSLAGIAIAIGAMVDAAVVLIDNMHKHLEQEAGPISAERRWEIVADSASEVGPAIFFSLLVITVGFLPVFGLEAQEGRLFAPLAFTKTFAMAGAALLAVTLIPVTLGWFVRGRIRPESENPVSRALVRGYRPVLGLALRHRWVTLGAAAVILALTLIPVSRLGSEFMPRVEEGTILFMPMTLPGVSVEQAARIMQHQNAVLASFPEVESVIGKAGRANTPTDPAPLEMFETLVNLKPTSEWRRGVDYDSLVAELDAAVRTPGVMNVWTMPIQNRIEMLATGMRSPVGVQIFGDDLNELERLGEEIEGLLHQVEGTRSAVAERGASGSYLDVVVDRREAARYGLNVQEVQRAMMTAVGGEVATRTVEGRERYAVQVRYPRELRQSAERIGDVLVDGANGAPVPLGQLARIQPAEGPMVVNTENAFPVSRVFIDVEGRDLGGYVAEADALLRERITLPPGYRLEWAGQYQAMERVRERLGLLVPLTLGLIFILLFLHFRSGVRAVMVMATLPFALVGGFWLIWLLGFNTSVAVWVGFIALAGVAAELGVVMLLYLDQAFERRLREAGGGRLSPESIREAALEGATTRVRPVMMTVVSDIGGLLPLLWVAGVGAATMQRVAAPMVGGLLTAMILTLVVLPVIYASWRELEMRRKQRR